MTLLPDAPLATRCREAYAESEDFGLFAVATSSDDGAATITFVGSNDLVDWLYNLRIGMAWSGEVAGRMHAGFADLWARSRASIRAMIDRHWRDGESIDFAGHSLGGMLATLSALDCRTRWPDRPVSLTTFGTPRLFDSPTQARLGPLIAGRHYRHGLDPIPYRPSFVPGVMPYVSLPGLRQLSRPMIFGGVPWPRIWPRSWNSIPFLGDHAIERYEAALGGPIVSMRMGGERRETMRIEW